MAINSDELAKAIDEVKELLPMICRQLRAYYNELVSAGFDEKQALEIVKAHGLAGYMGGTNGKS